MADSKTNNSTDVANWFTCNIDRDAGDSITHLKLQKLMYYAQAWSLAILNKPIFEDDFEAWAHGPVLPRIYEIYKEYGYTALPTCDCENNITDEFEEILLEVKRVYGEKSAKSLEDLTHQESPWINARGGRAPEEKCNEIITKDSMMSFYSELLKVNE